MEISLTKQFNVEKIRKDFPILARTVNNKPLIYFDNSATTQKPKIVIETLNKFFETHNANIHRGIHKLAEESTLLYEEAHKKVSDFINAEFEEVIFTKNTTESLNLLAYSLFNNLKENDEIIVSQMEHHSNFVPWQQLAKSKNFKLNFVKIVHENNSLLIVDAAQSVPHMKIDVKDLDVDFLAFSGHKIYGPTGIGVLYGKKHLLKNMAPFLYGGDMIREVTFEYTNFNQLPWKFEAGTPQIAEAVALGSAIDYLNEIGPERIEEYEKYLTNYLYKKLSEQKDVKIYGSKNRSSLISFNISDLHPHDVASILDSEGIAIRAGHMCAMPLVREVLKEPAVCRVSLSFYNTKEEIDKFILALDKVRRTFKK